MAWFSTKTLSSLTSDVTDHLRGFASEVIAEGSSDSTDPQTELLMAKKQIIDLENSLSGCKEENSRLKVLVEDNNDKVLALEIQIEKQSEEYSELVQEKQSEILKLKDAIHNLETNAPPTLNLDNEDNCWNDAEFDDVITLQCELEKYKTLALEYEHKLKEMNNSTSLRQSNEFYLEHLDGISKELDSMKLVIDETKVDSSALEEKISQLTIENDNHKQNSLKLSEQNESIIGMKSELEAKLKAIETAYSDLQAEFISTSQTLEDVKHELLKVAQSSNHPSDIENFKTNIEVLSSRNTKVEAELQNVKMLLTEKDNEITEVKRLSELQISEVLKKRDITVDELSQQILCLKGQIKDVKALKDQLISSEDDIRHLQNLLTENEDKYDILVREHETTMSKFVMLQSEFDNSEKRFFEQIETEKQLCHTLVRSLNYSLHTDTPQLVLDFSNQSFSLSGFIERFVETISNIIINCRLDNKKLEDTLNSSKCQVSELQNNIVLSKEMLNDALNSNKSLNTVIEDKNINIEDLTCHISKLKSENISIKELVDNLKEQLVQKEDLCKNLESRIQEKSLDLSISSETCCDGSHLEIITNLQREISGNGNEQKEPNTNTWEKIILEKEEEIISLSNKNEKLCKLLESNNITSTDNFFTNDLNKNWSDSSNLHTSNQNNLLIPEKYVSQMKQYFLDCDNGLSIEVICQRFAELASNYDSVFSKNAFFSQQLENYMKEISDLKNDLDEQHKQKSHLQEEIRNLLNKLNDASKEKAYFGEELVNMSTQLCEEIKNRSFEEEPQRTSDLEISNKSLELQLGRQSQSYETKLSKFNDELSAVKMAYDELNEKYCHLSSEFSVLQSTNVILEKSIENFKLEHSEIFNEFGSYCKTPLLDATISTVFKQQKELVENLQDSLKNTRIDFENCQKRLIEDSESKLESCNVKITQSQEKIQSLELSLTEKESIINSNRDELAELRKENFHFIGQLEKNNNATATVQDQLAEAKNELVLAMQANKKLQSEISQLNSSNDTVSEDLFTYKNEVSELNKELQIKESKISDLNGKISMLGELLTENESSFKSKMQIFLEEKNTITQQAYTMKSMYQQLLTAYNQKQQENMDLQSIISGMQTESRQSSVDLQLTEEDAKLSSVSSKPDVVTSVSMVSNEVNDELEDLKNSYQTVQEEFSQLMNKFKQKDLLVTEKQNEILEVSNREGKLLNELSRLRDHMLTMEQQYTEEAIKAENREVELRSRLQLADSKLEKSSQSVAEAAQEAVLRNKDLGKQLKEAESQISVLKKDCDAFRLETKEANSQLAIYSKSLKDLQLVLEQFQHDKAREITAETEKCRKEVENCRVEKKLLEDRIQNLMVQCADNEQVILESGNLVAELESRSQEIDVLHVELSEKQKQMLSLRSKIERLSGGGETVEKVLVKNMLLGYFTSPHNKRTQVLEMLARFFEFSDEEQQRLGLNNKGGWFSGWLPAQTPNQPQLNESFSEQFIRFLENESSPKQAPELPQSVTKTSQLSSFSASQQGKLDQTRFNSHSTQSGFNPFTTGALPRFSESRTSTPLGHSRESSFSEATEANSRLNTDARTVKSHQILNSIFQDN